MSIKIYDHVKEVKVTPIDIPLSNALECHLKGKFRMLDSGPQIILKTRLQTFKTLIRKCGPVSKISNFPFKHF